jgi:RND family efflux transporter MFP subunit
MNSRKHVVSGTLFALLIAGCALAAWWVLTRERSTGPKPGAAAAPATVPKPLKEDQVNTIALTDQAMARLALQTGLVERKPVRRVRTYGGEVMVPPGQSITVAAPVSGVVRSIAATALQPGREVKKGQPLLQLLPLLTPESRANLAAMKVESEGQVRSAQTQLDAARTALDRAKRMLQSHVGSQKTVDEAQAQFDLAGKSLEAATARRNLLAKVAGEAESGTAAPLGIESPEDGLLRNVSALPGQNVPAGAALFEVVDLRRVWVRVPVYVGDLPEVDRAANAEIGNLTTAAGEARQRAVPATAPPSANPAAGTVDLFYELEDRGNARHSPGERVGVTLTLKTEADSLTVPWASVISDIHGGTWLYEQTGPAAFVRRRTVVRYVVGDTAVLAVGPAPGTKVVTAGAAELFGTETGFTK